MRSRRALPGRPVPSVPASPPRTAPPAAALCAPLTVPLSVPLSVPLLLAVLVLTAGCVTVRPPEPAGAPRTAE
ncbi:hypothetical protein, partial [Streptomyces lavendulae]|uniref:hypothetical protein n=1 Tax=Streptomyces lavendulae TaxID=1914 RepID=UPI0036BFCE66